MSGIIKIGDMDNSDGTHESQNRVYSIEGVAPTISTMQGGNLQPKILTTELIRVGAIGVDVGESLRYNNPRIHQGNLVYDMNGLAATLTAQPCGVAGGYTPCYIDMKEVQCLRSVRTDYAKEIRKQYESGELDANRSDLQQLEPRNDDLSNTITTVQKDNLIMEVEQCKVIGGLSDEMKSNNGTQYYQQDRVYSVGDVAMCIPSNLPGGSYNYAVDTSDIKQVGYLENGTGQHQSNTVYSTDGLSPTIATLQGGTQQIKIMDGEDMSEEQKTIKIRQATEQGYIECEVGGVANFGYPESRRRRRGRVIDNGNTSPTLQAGEPSVCKIESSIAIRKLTPRECWRLMDFTDEQFDRAAYQIKVEYLEGGNDLCCANFRVVPEKQRQKDMETYVLCTINDSQDMEILKTIKNSLADKQENEKMQNVSFVIEKLEDVVHSDCATNTTRCITFMGMQCILMEEYDQQVMAITVQAEPDNMNTEKSMRITMESNLDQNKLYTILILIKLIIQSKIFGATIPTVSINGYMQLIEDSSNNMGLKILNLKMESTCSRVSSSQLYKQAGNSIVVACLEAIFSQLGIGEEWNKRNQDFQ